MIDLYHLLILDILAHPFVIKKKITSELWLVNISLTDEMVVQGEIRALVFA